MAITCKIRLEHTGLDMEIPTYITVQDVTLRRMMHRPTGKKWWVASARVLAHASREAKDGNLAPLETSTIETEFNPMDGDALTAIYLALKQVPRFANAVDA